MGIQALSLEEIELASGGNVYAKAAGFWTAVGAAGALMGQPEVVFAAAMMVAYNTYYS